MASEISHTPETNRALRAVAAGIAAAASAQAKESIDHAIQSFAWASIKEKRGSTDEWLALLGETTVQAAGHADDPLKYFTQLSSMTKPLNHNGIISMDEVISSLRKQDLHFQQGVASFLKSGIQEALASLKISSNPNIPLPVIPVALDELISPEKLRNPDRTKLQASLQVINEMFSTLKNMQSGITDLRVNMLRSIRV